MELMNSSKEFSVDYYLSNKILKQLQIQESSNIFKTGPERIFSDLKKENYDLVLIGTVHRYFNVFRKIVDNFNTSVIVHNLNFSRLSGFQLLGKVFQDDFVYRLKLLLKEGLVQSPEVYRSAKNHLVLDRFIAKKQSKKYLPLFFTKSSESHRKSIITIVIPGAVSQKRRDYKMILDELRELRRSNLSAEQINVKENEFRRREPSVEKIANVDSELRRSDLSNKTIQIVFLGKAEGKELIWLKNFKKENPHIQIKYFTEKIPQYEFDQWMNRADILWCPIQIETEFFSHKEIYGETKMTGNIGDAINYGKLAVFPTDYSTDYGFLVPQEENIEAQLMTLQKNYTFDFKERFSKENVVEELHSVLRTLI